MQPFTRSCARNVFHLHTTGWIFDIQRYSIHDGPGIRTTVFFKGCPLKCLWCSNPESQERRPELMYFSSVCTRCYRCVAACPSGATSVGHDGGIAIERRRCTACGKCVSACPNQARAISGYLATVGSVLDVVCKDMLFYRNSGGGITLSGGECLYQPEFAAALLRGAQDMGIHTAVETCGYASLASLEKVLQFADLVLYDVKCLDSDTHARLTGVDNGIILERLRRIARLGKDVVIRVPLIPGLNDDKGSIEALAGLALANDLRRVDLLPYHQMGKNKYAGLGRTYQDGGPLRQDSKKGFLKVGRPFFLSFTR